MAIGDLHGDVQATRKALQLAGAIDGDGRWTGGRLVLVQTGDQLDRGDDEPDILSLLQRLSEEARAAGGALHVLNGNHEVMNVQGDFRYVTEDGFKDYAAATATSDHEREVHALPVAQKGRANAFLSGGPAAKQLSARSVVIQVGDNVFVHGGLLERHVRYGLGRINREVSEWMLAPKPRPIPAIVNGDDAPIWLRLYSHGVPRAEACAELDRVLAALGAKRLIVGHTVQERGINSACSGKVWRIDVGLSRYYGQRPPSVLEISGETTRIIEGTAAPVPSASSAPQRRTH